MYLKHDVYMYNTTITVYTCSKWYTCIIMNLLSAA